MRGIAFTILIGVLIFLFTATFAILGRGDYNPSPEGEGSAPPPAVILG